MAAAHSLQQLQAADSHGHTALTEAVAEPSLDQRGRPRGLFPPVHLPPKSSGVFTDITPKTFCPLNLI